MKKLTALILILSILFLIGCYANVHKIGSGASGNSVQTAKQWYAIAGLIKINEVDTNAMVGSATNYEIKTEFTIVDLLISGVTGGIIDCRTVTVKK
jgi:hypothetical protein